jgi:hypothetical protein
MSRKQRRASLRWLRCAGCDVLPVYHDGSYRLIMLRIVNRSLAHVVKVDATVTLGTRSSKVVVCPVCLDVWMVPGKCLGSVWEVFGGDGRVNSMTHQLSSCTSCTLVLTLSPPDLCAGMSCVDHATCNPDTGRCDCQLPYAGHGPICVQGECLGVTCRQHSFCQRGLCYCRVGYHPDGDSCVAGQPDGVGGCCCPLVALVLSVCAA